MKPPAPDWARVSPRDQVPPEFSKAPQWGISGQVASGGQLRVIDVAFSAGHSESLALFFEAVDAVSGLPVATVDFVIIVGSGGTSRQVNVLPATTPYIVAGETIQVTASQPAGIGALANVRGYASRTSANPTV